MPDANSAVYHIWLQLQALDASIEALDHVQYELTSTEFAWLTETKQQLEAIQAKGMLI